MRRTICKLCVQWREISKWQNQRVSSGWRFERYFYEDVKTMEVLYILAILHQEKGVCFSRYAQTRLGQDALNLMCVETLTKAVNISTNSTEDTDDIYFPK